MEAEDLLIDYSMQHTVVHYSAYNYIVILCNFEGSLRSMTSFVVI